MTASAFSYPVRPNQPRNSPTLSTSSPTKAQDNATARTGETESAPSSTRIPVKSWAANTFKPLVKPTSQPKKPIKRISDRRKKEHRQYLKDRKCFLEMHAHCENPLCMALSRGVRPNFSTSVHHMRGRAGRLLLAKEFWKATCEPCHKWIHEHPNQARKVGMLCQRGDWGRQPQPR